MSSLAETYALGAGVRIDKPYLLEAFYPLKTHPSKAILIHASAGNNNFPAKIYDYYNDVVTLLKPIIEKFGYKIYQIGGAGEYELKNVESLCGKTNFHQTAYLIKRCALLIGNDSMNAHIAGSFNTPSVVLYGPTDVKNHGPYWKNQKTVLLESHRSGAKRPSYLSQENPKTINFIPPELVVNSSLEILGIEEKTSNKSLFFGDFYTNAILDVYPDLVVNPSFNPNVPINIRMDYLHNEDILAKNLQNRKCNIAIDKGINADILKAFKKNILGIRCKLNEDFPRKTIKDIKNSGIQHVFYTEDMNEENLSKMRFDFFDYCFFDNLKNKTKVDFESSVEKYLNKKLDEPIKYDKLYYRSNKFILSSKGVSLSKASLDSGIYINNFDENEEKIKDTEEFWKEQNHFYIYEKQI